MTDKINKLILSFLNLKNNRGLVIKLTYKNINRYNLIHTPPKNSIEIYNATRNKGNAVDDDWIVVTYNYNNLLFEELYTNFINSNLFKEVIITQKDELITILEKELMG